MEGVQLSRRKRVSITGFLVCLVAISSLLGSPGAGASVTHYDRAGIWEPRVVADPNVTQEFHNLAYLLGARRHRMAIRWDEVEPTAPIGGQHTYKWPSGADNAYSWDLAAGRRPLVVLYAAPSWAWGGSCSSCHGNVPPDASHLADWNSFVYQAARHFPNADLEIWNEPNLQEFWGCEFRPEGGCTQRLQPNSTEYVSLLSQARSAVNSANQDMEYLGIPHSVYIVGGSLATVRGEQTTGNLPIYRFAKQMIEKGALNMLDAFSIHLYPMENPNNPGVYDARTLKPAYCQLAGANEGECAGKTNWWGNGALIATGHSNFSNIWATELGASRTGSEHVTQGQQANIEALAVQWLDTKSNVKAWFVGPLFSGRNMTVPAEEPDNNPGADVKDLGLSLTEWVRPFGPNWTHGSEYAGVTPVLAFSRIRETMKERADWNFFDMAFLAFESNRIRFVTRCDVWCVARINSGWVVAGGQTYQMVWDDFEGWGAAGTVMSYIDGILRPNGSVNYPPESTWRWMEFSWAGAPTPTPTSWCVNVTAVGWQGEATNEIVSNPPGKLC